MPNILHRVGIAAERARVLEALTTVDGIRAWWSSETDGDASQGGAFQFRRNRLQLLQADRNLVKWRYSVPAEDWVGTEIVFRLEWRDGQTFVLFNHEDWSTPYEFMRHYSTKWATFLLSLKGLIEQGKGRSPGTRRSRWTPEACHEHRCSDGKGEPR